MKALTLTQPWATLVAVGAKRIETRGWKTGYRGPLAIHAAKGYPGRARILSAREPFKAVLKLAGYRTWGESYAAAQLAGLKEVEALTGRVVATCTLVDCRPITADSKEWGANGILWPLTDRERAFGDYTPGRWAWLLADVQPFVVPMSARGALGLWEWNAVSLT